MGSGGQNFTNPDDFGVCSVGAIQSCTAPNPSNGNCSFNDILISSNSQRQVRLSICRIYHSRINGERLEIVSGASGGTSARFKHVTIQVNGPIGPTTGRNGCNHTSNRLFIYSNNGTIISNTGTSYSLEARSSGTLGIFDWFWPLHISPNYYSAKFITCAKVIESKVVVYPDINWEIRFTFPASAPQSQRSTATVQSTRADVIDIARTRYTSASQQSREQETRFDFNIECKENQQNSTRFDFSRRSREIKSVFSKFNEILGYAKALTTTISEFSSGWYLNYSGPSTNGTASILWGWFEESRSTLCKYSVRGNIEFNILTINAGYDVASFVSRRINDVLRRLPIPSRQLAISFRAGIDIEGTVRLRFNGEIIIVEGVESNNSGQITAGIRIGVTLEASLELRAFGLGCTGTAGAYTGISGDIGLRFRRSGINFVAVANFEGIVVRLVFDGEVAGIRRRYQGSWTIASSHLFSSEENPL